MSRSVKYDVWGTYLTEGLEESVEEFSSRFRELIDTHPSKTQLAKKVGVSRTYLYKFGKDRNSPQFETVHRILKGLGYEISIAKL